MNQSTCLFWLLHRSPGQIIPKCDIDLLRNGVWVHSVVVDVGCMLCEWMDDDSGPGNGVHLTAYSAYIHKRIAILYVLHRESRTYSIIEANR